MTKSFKKLSTAIVTLLIAVFFVGHFYIELEKMKQGQDVVYIIDFMLGLIIIATFSLIFFIDDIKAYIRGGRSRQDDTDKAAKTNWGRFVLVMFLILGAFAGVVFVGVAAQKMQKRYYQVYSDVYKPCMVLDKFFYNKGRKNVYLKAFVSNSYRSSKNVECEDE